MTDDFSMQVSNARNPFEKDTYNTPGANMTHATAEFQKSTNVGSFSRRRFLLWRLRYWRQKFDTTPAATAAFSTSVELPIATRIPLTSVIVYRIDQKSQVASS